MLKSTAALVLLFLACATGAAAKCPAGAVPLAVGTDLQRAVRSAPTGTDFCIGAGEHRMQAIRPKRGQRFFGEKGAVLNGSRLLTSFSRQGAFWVASGQTQQGDRPQTENCLPARPRCSYPEVLYIDDEPLIAVDAPDKVGQGTFFFDYDADKIFFADDPSGRKVEASVSPYAFLGSAPEVTVAGLRIEKYSTPIQAGAVGYNLAPQRWTVRSNRIRLNHGVGLSVGSGSRVESNLIESNGEMGIGCVGDDVLIEDNEIAGNGFFAGLDPAWEGGGGKCAVTRRLLVRRNYSHHNNSYGFWTDIDNIDTVYEDNRIAFNANAGISHEISYRAVIRNNRFVGNGRDFDVWLWGGAIQIQNSRDVEVYGNSIVISEGGNGICLIQQKRGKGKYGPHVTVDNDIHDNTITSKTPDVGASGAIADHAPDVLRRGNNRFARNVYRVASGGNDQWAWVDNFYTWRDYLRVSGQEKGSRLIVKKP